jgi:hypothetical protein
MQSSAVESRMPPYPKLTAPTNGILNLSLVGKHIPLDTTNIQLVSVGGYSGCCTNVVAPLVLGYVQSRPRPVADAADPTLQIVQCGQN